MAMYVKFWGTRGSIPTPGPSTQKYGGNTSCVEVRCGDTLVICDGGTGLRELGIELQRRHGKSPIEAHMFFSHAHWDHIQGFPFFTPIYVPTNTFHVYGVTGGDHSMFHLLSGQMKSEYFPVRFSDLGAKILHGEMTEHFRIGEMEVTTYPQWHPGTSMGIALTYQGKKVVFATDNELDEMLLNREEVEKDLQIERQIPKDYVDFVRGADLLIADGQYFDDEYSQKRGWGHPRVGTVVDLAVQAGVKQLAITHHDPMHTDRDVDAKIAMCQKRAQSYANPPVVFGARESVELKIG